MVRGGGGVSSRVNECVRGGGRISSRVGLEEGAGLVVE